MLTRSARIARPRPLDKVLSGYHGKHRHVSRTSGWRIALAPWVIISLVAGFVVAGGVAGYMWLWNSGCGKDTTTVTVVASPDQNTGLDELAQRFNDENLKVDDSCAKVEVVQGDSANIAGALGSKWEKRNGELPDVWVPDSSLWVQLAAARAPAAQLLPESPGFSLATSPVVLAAPAPMAKVLAEAGYEAGMLALTEAFTEDARWERVGKPEWDRFELGQLDPRQATAGLHLLSTLADGERGNVATEISGALAVEQRVNSYRESSYGYISQLAMVTGEDGLANFPIFPALERDVALYNSTKPAVELTALYPKGDAPAVADYPYTVLRAPWVSTAETTVASKFGKYLGSPEAREVLRSASFRAPDGKIDGAYGVDTARGFVKRIDPNQVSCQLPGSEIQRVLSEWELARGSMADTSMASQ